MFKSATVISIPFKELVSKTIHHIRLDERLHNSLSQPVRERCHHPRFFFQSKKPTVKKEFICKRNLVKKG
jgi:hypothetical protein